MHPLIYLCANCHTTIDTLDVDYPTVRLLKIKAEHESKVRDAINAAFADVGFPELAQATAWIMQTLPGAATQDLKVIAPDEKIKKNSLTASSRGIIAMGLSVVREVRNFVEGEAQIDSEFPDRLKAGFLEEYFRLLRNKHRSDELFDLMCQVAQRGMKEQAKRSAGLAVLIYLFECCEVFEK